MKTKLIFSAIALIALFGALIYLPTPSLQAQATGFNISGWSWSDNVGFFDMSGLSVNESGNFSGYAWNDGIGQVNFAPTDGTPPNGGTKGVRISGSNVVGWARACSVFASGCSGALKDNFSRGDWDGWIEMTAVNYDPATGRFSGYAWGDLNIGWLSFGVAEESGCEATGTCPDTEDCDSRIRTCGYGCVPGDPTCDQTQDVTLMVDASLCASLNTSITASPTPNSGSISNCTTSNCSGIYPAETEVTLSTSDNLEINWGGVCVKGSSCSVTLNNDATVNACTPDVGYSGVTATIYTGVRPRDDGNNKIYFIKSNGLAYPASSLPFRVNITGVDSIGLSFDWVSATKGGSSIPDECLGIQLINNDDELVTSVSNNTNYKLLFPNKCADNSGNSQYNGVWTVPFTFTVEDESYRGQTTTLDFTDSNQQ